MTDIHRLRRRYLLASIGLIVAIGASFTMGNNRGDSAVVLVPFVMAFVCAEVIRRTATRIERLGDTATGHGRVTSVREVREGDVIEGYAGLGPVTAVRHHVLRSHVFTQNVGLIFNRFERVRVLAGE